MACQTVIRGDVSLYLPPQEAIERRVRQADRAAERAISLPVQCDWRNRPWIRRVTVRMQPPSLADNTTDFERLTRDLRVQHSTENVRVTLPVLRKLASVLRREDWLVTAVLEQGTWLDEDAGPRIVDLLPGHQTRHAFGVAVDIGTTSNVVYLVDIEKGEVVDSAIEYNGQIACGEDVISRIIYSQREGGLEHLRHLVTDTINGLLTDLARRNGIEPSDIYLMTVAGNTTMVHLFLGLDPAHIRLEPYIPTTTHPLPVLANELGLRIHPEATVDCLPGVGSYVGADITAGVLSSKMFMTDQLSLFIDVGTNGEIVLGNSDWLLACACSAGPAFEGSGVNSGMRATNGAIEDVWIHSETWEPTYRTIGDDPPRGICGSGIISLLAEMFITGVIDKAGRINRSVHTPYIRMGETGPEYLVASAEKSSDGRAIVINEVDIANLIRAKAAIYAGFSVLTRSVGVELADVEQVLIGGAFGKYIDVEKAIQIGLLPDMPWDRFHYLGNTSALGAYAALLCRDMRRELVEIASKMTYLELSADNSFMNEFTSSLFLPHTDADRFPSVVSLLERAKTARDSVS